MWTWQSLHTKKPDQDSRLMTMMMQQIVVVVVVVVAAVAALKLMFLVIYHRNWHSEKNQLICPWNYSYYSLETCYDTTFCLFWFLYCDQLSRRYWLVLAAKFKTAFFRRGRGWKGL
jgi:hypothetical protein